MDFCLKSDLTFGLEPNRNRSSHTGKVDTARGLTQWMKCASSTPLAFPHAGLQTGLVTGGLCLPTGSAPVIDNN